MIKNLILLGTLFLSLTIAQANNTPSIAKLPIDIFHEFHISKCQIEFNEESKALQISLHMFLDDLEAALDQQGARKMFLCTDKEHKKAEKYLFRYLQQRFQLNVNEETVDFEFIGKEQSEDLQAVWCYLEVTNIPSLQSLEITNSLLMEVFDDQKNIVQVMASGGQQGYFLLQKGQENDKVNFK